MSETAPIHLVGKLFNDDRNALRCYNSSGSGHCIVVADRTEVYECSAGTE